MCSPTLGNITINSESARTSKRTIIGKRLCPIGNRDAEDMSIANENRQPTTRTTVLPCQTAAAADRTRTCIQRPPVSTASDIRLRFLNRLGFQKAVAASPTPSSTSCEPQQDTAVQSSTLPENMEDSSVKSTSTERSTSTVSCLSTSSCRSKSSSRRSVSFDDSVTVRPIPSANAYSPRVKHQIWADPVEIMENATRNSIEFAADNFDWQAAMEEEDMVLADNGQLVHPVHYYYYQQQQQQQQQQQHNNSMQRNFLLVMAARAQQAQQCK